MIARVRGCWGCGVESVDRFWTKGVERGIIVRHGNGWLAMDGDYNKIRSKPYASRGRARLAIERAAAKATGVSAERPAEETSQP